MDWGSGGSTLSLKSVTGLFIILVFLLSNYTKTKQNKKQQQEKQLKYIVVVVN